MTIEQIKERIAMHYRHIDELVEAVRKNDKSRGKQYFKLRGKILLGHVNDTADELHELMLEQRLAEERG